MKRLNYASDDIAHDSIITAGRERGDFFFFTDSGAVIAVESSFGCRGLKIVDGPSDRL